VGNHGGVATAVSTIVAILAATTAVAAVVVPMSVVVVAVVLARLVRQHQRRRQWSGQHFVGVECRRSSSWTGGVQADFLHRGIRLDVEVDDDGVDIR
jgi:membrane protein implicated in regulation of membrane protease activity